jgi:hypothetical protein
VRLLLVFVLLLITPYFRSQRPLLEGYCYDSKNNPIKGVTLFNSSDPSERTSTDAKGRYQILGHYNDTLRLTFSYKSIEQKRSFYINNRLFQDKLPNVVFNIKETKSIVIIGTKDDPFDLTNLPTIELNQMINVEKYLTLTKGAVSNNELTSNYNVRGGNYDENLVYVNGFQVYRPFLTRSGQQEGMSFIHSSLVESIRFSAGGFDAQFGDRLSSVLDITYKNPTAFKSSLTLSLLNQEIHVEDSVGKKWTYLLGARYRSNRYLLNSLPTKGAYNPVFSDGQILTTCQINPKVSWSILAHYSSNNYQFEPRTSNTDFGTANEAYSFRIYFDGQEQTRFQTGMVGTSLSYNPNEKVNMNLMLSAFQSDEKEYYDIQGQYYINELETDPSKEEYGDSIAVLGIGTFLNHARNRLFAQIYAAQGTGEVLLKKDYSNAHPGRFIFSQLKWGLGYEMHQFNDRLSEWKMIDSAGYSLPQTPVDNEIKLFETLKGDLALVNHRSTAFGQWNFSCSFNQYNASVKARQKSQLNGKKTISYLTDTLAVTASKVAFSIGNRLGYTSVNQEFYVTPRITVMYYPRNYMARNGQVVRRNVSYRLSTGLYYQPPMYREFRTFDGTLNPGVQSQKSVHAVLGADFNFNLWERDSPFKFSGELYYKYLWDVNPYEIENVRTRYYANNNAIAYAYGIDLNVNGEFVPGIESFFKVGLLQTKEDIKNDQYTEYYNAAGERIIFGYSQDQVVVDSAIFFPGYIPRPTEQWLTLGTLVQDEMPGLEQFTVQMGLQYGAPLPYGPPGIDRFKDTLRMKSYFRVDLGLTYQLNSKKSGSLWSKHVSKSNISLEIFNVLGINNVLSKQWIQDVQGRFYSIPNYLTQRRVNLKFTCAIK